LHINDFVQLEVPDALAKWSSLPASQAEKWRAAYLEKNRFDLADPVPVVALEAFREEEIDDLPILTIDYFPGQVVSEVLGVVKGSAWQGVDLLSDALSDFTTLVGQSSDAVGGYAVGAADKALAEMRRQARSVGAEAVIGTNVAVIPSVSGARHVILATAVGTAVKLDMVPDEPSETIRAGRHIGLNVAIQGRYSSAKSRT
jgi:uncharacterized protein YbjQ (UPF0145 family)